MKKTTLKHLLVSAILLPALAVFSACTDPSKGGNGEGETETDDKGNTFVVSDNITPIRYTVDKYIGGKEGVSITVTENTPDNIKFLCEPGEEVMSYRINLYPISTLYNTFINQLNASDGMESFTTEQTADMLYQIISNTESETSGGVLMNKDSFGDEYLSCEFDWMNSPYKRISIKPNSGYLIVAQAYFDENATSAGDLCLCFVQTEDRDIVGNPQVLIDVEVGYYSYRVKHIPNSECGGYYYLGTTTDEIQQYIDAYGEKMYMELLRHYGALVPNNPDGNFSYDARDQVQGVEYCATALAVDVNGTPVKTLSRRDFTLLDTPTDIEKATGYIKPNPKKVAATVAHFITHLDANCIRLTYYAYPAAQADAIMAKSEEERKEIAGIMVRSLSENYPGWQVANPNYSYDRETNKLTGTSYDDKTQFMHELKPETEYKILYTVMNGFGEIADLMVSEPFTTKKYVIDAPETCTAECTLEITSATRSAFYVGTKYNSENTAAIYWQYYWSSDPEFNTGEFTLPKGRDEAETWPRGDLNDTNGWLYWFLVYRDPRFGVPWPNTNFALFADGWGTDSDFYSGFSSGSDVCFAYMLEDWNGVLSPIYFFEGSTQKAVAGDNPAGTISWTKKNDNEYQIKFECNEETSSMQYIIFDQKSPEAMTSSVSALLNNQFTAEDYEEVAASFEEYTTNYGIKSNETVTYSTIAVDSQISVITLVPVGGISSPVFGETQIVVYKGGEFKTLKEYLGVK